MKGQYLAVETVFTFGLGLIVAIGVITLFNQYKTDALSQAEPHQAEMIQSEVLLAMDALRETDEDGKLGSGSYDLDLPDTLAGRSYTLAMDDGLVIGMGAESYEMSLTGYSGYRLSGSAPGGDVTIFKRGNNFTVRAQ